MAKTGEKVIATRLSQMTGLPEDTDFLLDFAEQFEGPIHFEANEQLWSTGDRVGYLWYIHFGYGFDRILLEDGTKMLNGMTEPGLFVCDEKSLLWGGLSKTDCIMYTPGTAYRISHNAWRDYVLNNEQMRNVLLNINAHFVQMRKLRLLKMKMMDKVAYWKYIQDRFPGIEKYCSQTEIAKYFGVSKSTMHRIMKSS
mgnify:CR=1 FL=1